MIVTLYISVIILLANTVIGQVVNQCGENEEYNCGSLCTETCTFKPEICVKMCRFGCFCKEGYVRQSNDTKSRCVTLEECKLINAPTCSENEEYLTCESACPPTCDDWSYPLPKLPKPCPKLCLHGCFCKKGLFRRKDGACVKDNQCCGANEVFTDCGSACVATCNNKPEICTEQCVAGCFCRHMDYVRANNSTGSTCIHHNECPK